jgi:hypothetical protein
LLGHERGHVGTEPEEVRERRLARNEALLREVNERIEKLTEPFAGSDPIGFVCECVDTTCARHVELTRADYEAVRSTARRFVVAPDHDEPEVENVVERHRGYIVVEKIGAGARVADATDPRRSED